MGVRVALRNLQGEATQFALVTLRPPPGSAGSSNSSASAATASNSQGPHPGGPLESSVSTDSTVPTRFSHDPESRFGRRT